MKPVIIPFYLPSTISSDVSKKVLVYLYRREFYLVDNLRAYILNSNNIIGPERITNNILARRATITSYSLDIMINLR